jgi:hypothetical protein
MLKKSLKIEKNNLFILAADIYLMYFLCMNNLRVSGWVSRIPHLFSLMEVIVCLLLLCKILEDSIVKRSSFAKILIFAGCVVPGMFMSLDFTVIPFLFLFVIASRGVDFKKVILHYAVLHSAWLAITMIGCRLGIFVTGYRWDSNGNKVFFNGYGAVVAPIFLFSTTLLWVYILKERINIIQVVCLLAADLYVYMQSKLEMQFYMVILVLICAYLLKHFDLSENKLIKTFCVSMTTIFSALALGMTVFYRSDNPFMTMVDSFITGRLRFGQKAIETYGIHLFGTQIEWSFVQDQSYTYADCGYLKYMLMYGVVFLIFMVVAFTLMSKMAVEANDMYLCLVICAISMDAMVSPMILYLYDMPWWILLGKIIYSDESEEYNLRKA